MVGSSGLEPPTSRLSAECSNQLSYKPVSFRFFVFLLTSPFAQLLRVDGGDEGNRTLDPLLAGQVLSQLSYTPIFMGPRSLKIEQLTSDSCNLILNIKSIRVIQGYLHILTFSIERR